jgi:hypothetical protein
MGRTAIASTWKELAWSLRSRTLAHNPTVEGCASVPMVSGRRAASSRRSSRTSKGPTSASSDPLSAQARSSQIPPGGVMLPTDSLDQFTAAKKGLMPA